MNALLRVLESLARIFSDQREIKIKESGRNVFHIHGNTIYVSISPEFELSDEEKLRIIVDALNHECEHINLGFTKRKLEEFIRETGYGPLSRWVLTIVEDHYTDFSRLKKWRGLKKARALFSKLVMEREPPVNIFPEREAALRGLHMINYSGFAKGEELVSSKLKKFFELARNCLLEVRDIHDFDSRKEVANFLLSRILSFGPKNLIPSDDLDWKIDFQICSGYSGIQIEFTEPDKSLDVNLDLDKIMEWNSVDDLSPSGFEKSIMDNIYSLETEFRKQEKLMKIVAKRDMRIDPNKKPIVPESILNELVNTLERIKTEEYFIESEWGEEVNIRNYLRRYCGENNLNLYYSMKPSDTGGRAILIALDLSGSMKDKIDETIKACHIVAKSAEILNDKIAAFGFQEKTGAVNFTKITPIKLWHERYRPEFFTGLDVSGNTPLREAILEVRDWLDPIAARQKVAMVFTDAEPTSSTPEQVYRVVCGLGARVIGVGIGTKVNPSMLRRCFGNSYLWAPNIRDLPRLISSVYLSLLDSSSLNFI